MKLIRLLLEVLKSTTLLYSNTFEILLLYSTQVTIFTSILFSTRVVKFQYFTQHWLIFYPRFTYPDLQPGDQAADLCALRSSRLLRQPPFCQQRWHHVSTRRELRNSRTSNRKSINRIPILDLLILESPFGWGVGCSLDLTCWHLNQRGLRQSEA